MAPAALVSCEWWTFNPQFEGRLIGNSNIRPTYAIFVHAGCGECDAIYAAFKERCGNLIFKDNRE
jgi:hypothetical protein